MESKIFACLTGTEKQAKWDLNGSSVSSLAKKWGQLGQNEYLWTMEAKRDSFEVGPKARPTAENEQQGILNTLGHKNTERLLHAHRVNEF